MIIGMSTFLLSVADLSQTLSVIVTLFCFLGMVCYIMKNLMVFRLHQDLAMGGLNRTGQRKGQKVHMMKITIPFVLKLNESSTEADCVDCTVTSQVTYTVRVFWGVSIRELHAFLWKPWSLLRKSADSGSMLGGFYQLKGMEATSCEAHKETVYSIKFPSDSLDLGIPPRLHYPLVIFLIRDSQDVTLHPDETVALINVVHIKDTVCTLPTSILAQYLKQANGQLSCLKQLYLAAGNPFPTEDAGPFDKDDMSLWAVAGEQLCVVCQFYPLSRVLLPCRHTCVCAVCFEKLDRCPMCRSPFSEYFTVRAEDYFPVEKSPPATKPNLLSYIFNLGHP